MVHKAQFNLYLDKKLVKAVKRAALEADKGTSDFVAEILITHFEREKRIADQVEQLLAKKRGDTA
jgi:hypothetical protein